MTNTMKVIGLAATLVIVIVLPLYMLLEPSQQAELADEYRADAVATATDLYAQNCAICHGAAGDGIGENPPLSAEALRLTSEQDLARVIARGRDNTQMAAWAEEEGGVLSNAQIADLVTLIQHVNWDYVAQRVADLGLTPPEVIEMEISEDMLDSLAALPDGDVLGEGLVVYAEKCAACHGANGAGTVIAPAIDSPDLRAEARDDILSRVKNGIPGTLMAGWESTLTPDQISNVIDLIFRWPEIVQSGLEFPQIEPMQIASSPEMIATGERLYQIACKSCHGVDAYGTPMAPALNNQIFLAETPDAAIYQIIAGGIPDTRMPAWGSRLSDQDLQSLVAYLRSLEPAAPPIIEP